MRIFKTIIGLLPLLEIAGFIIVGRWIGLFPTLLLIVLTTILGFAIVRIQGFMTLQQMRRNMAEGRYPQTNMFGNQLFMFGGLLLIFPGFITDIVGLLLLLPLTRMLITRLLLKKVMQGQGKTQSKTIEGEYHRDD